MLYRRARKGRQRSLSRNCPGFGWRSCFLCAEMTHCSCPLEQEGLHKQGGSFEGAQGIQSCEPGPPDVWAVWAGTVLFPGGGRGQRVQVMTSPVMSSGTDD